MNISRQIEILTGIETDFPVTDWIADGVRLWPLIRNLLIPDFHFAGTTNQLADPLTVTGSAAGRFFKGLVRYAGAYLADLKRNQRLDRPRQAVFLTTSVPRVDLGGVWYNRLCDPIIDGLSRHGLSSLVLERNLAEDYRIPRYHGSMFISPRLQMQRIVARLTGRTSFSARLELPEYEGFIDRLKSLNVPLNLPTPQRLSFFIDALFRSAAFFRRVLAKSRPRLGLVVAYYGLDGMAFCLACRQLGLPVVDIQHGVQSKMNPYYGHWTHPPADGWELLPSVFWCWSRTEARAIEGWAAGLAGRHAPFVGGNLWLEMWRSGQSSLIRDFDRKLSAVERRPAERNILLALGPYKDSISPWLREAINASPPGWRWWIRIHPTRAQDEERYRELEQSITADYEARLATWAPLPALLRKVDLLVTDYSATVLEAEQFGLVSVMTDQKGAELYPEQIASGRALIALARDDFEAAVERAAAGRRSPEDKSAGETGNWWPRLERIIETQEALDKRRG